jgi:hypothetical protein
MLLGLDKQDRIHFRLPLCLEVNYRYFTELEPPREEEPIHVGRTENLSNGGLLLNADDPPLELAGDLLSGRVGLALSIELAGGEPVRALARVAWIEGLGQGGGCRMGLRFQEITGRSRDRITDLLLETYLG